MNRRTVGIFVGSLRKNSYSRKVAETLKALAPTNLDLKFVELGDLEMYNQDLDEEGLTPTSWIRFRDEVKQLDAVLFVTPEYNRSVPALLKNALDIGSRPYGQSVWNGKPGAVVGVTPGSLGAYGAAQVLRQSLVFLNIPAMQQPEAYIAGVEALYDPDGILIHEKTRSFFRLIMDSFETWISTNLDD